MENKDYVSLETAKLLKEVGYNYPFTHQLYTINWYSDKVGEEAKDPNNWELHKEVVEFRNDHIDYKQKIDNGAEKIGTYVPIIHLWDATKWLREKGIFITIDCDSHCKYRYHGYNVDDNDLFFRNKGVCIDDTPYIEFGEEAYNFVDYESALDKAIQIGSEYLK